MKLLKVLVLGGPNIWANFPVVEAIIDLGELLQHPVIAVEDIARPLSRALPGVARRLETEPIVSHGGIGLIRLLEAAVLELQTLSGAPASFSLVEETPVSGVYRLVFEYRDEGLARECLNAAREFCIGSADGKNLDCAPVMARLREAAALDLMGPSTRSIVEAAARRGIPCTRLDRHSLVQLGHARNQRRIRAAETDVTGAVAEYIAQDKQLTRLLLESVGVPVPVGYIVSSSDDAWETATEWVGLPVVVKPRDGNQGRGVATNLTTRKQVKAAYEAALRQGSAVIVEKHVAGSDYRLLVVDGKLAAASRRDPASVVADGVRSIRRLVEEKNQDPRRSDHHANVLSKIPLDEVSLQVLASQGYTPESVPMAGENVLIRRNANLSTGGTATDVTAFVHPRTAALAVTAASAVGLDVAGIDVIARDVSVPLEDQQGAVVEVNAAPGLRMHLAPSEGTPRQVGEAIVEMLFRPGKDGRIPIAAVTGSNGKTTVTRFLAHILRGTGKYIGMTCTDGIFLDGRRVFAEDCSGPISASMVLKNPIVEMAVFETARGGILRSGLGFDRCQVAVVTNIREGDHLGQEGIHTLADLARVKRTIVNVVSPDGAAVLNADDPLVAAMAPHCPGRVIYFGIDEKASVIANHRGKGGSAIFVREGVVVIAGSEGERELLPLEEIPLTFGGRMQFEVENALAALGGAWAIGTGHHVLIERARSFSTSMDCVPGRMNVIEIRGATVLVDYAHNASALGAVIGLLDMFPHRRRLAMYTMAGDRRDSDLVRAGEMLGDAFDEVIIYEAHTIRGRTPGEIGALMRQGLGHGGRIREIREIDNPIEAMQYALDKLKAGDLLLLQPNEVDEAVEFVREYLQLGATAKAPWSAQHFRKKGLPTGIPGDGGD